MSTYAKIIKHSIAPHDGELITFQLGFPRIILAEFNTHRMFSRNSASTRAIPTEKLISRVSEAPFVPKQFAMNQRGMQAGDAMSVEDQNKAEGIWQEASTYASYFSQQLVELGVHKQWAGRLLEPFMFTEVVLTSTDEGLANFFWLRNHPDAQPEIQELAQLMWEAYKESTPTTLSRGEWHLPYVEGVDVMRLSEVLTGPKLHEALLFISAARCCRVSYLNHGGTLSTLDEDVALCMRLIGSVPLHASPFEHQAHPDFRNESGWGHPELHGNLLGWLQYRKYLIDEYMWSMGQIWKQENSK